MRIGSRKRSSRWRKGPSWPGRLAFAVILLGAALFVVAAVRNFRRHDALVQWRATLERATGSPAWPEWVSTWPELPVPRRRHSRGADLRGPYAYAASHRHQLEYIPCYCGCVAQGHRSNLQCFVSSFRGDGAPVWTDHSFDCEMCVHIAREVMLMSSQRTSLSEIRRVIDQRYGHGSHGGTNTPLPSH